MKRLRWALYCTGVLAAAPVMSLAARSGSAVAASELARCAAIAAADDRLACFDRLAAAVAYAPRESAAPSTATEKTFGLPAPPVRATPAATAVIEAHISGVAGNRVGRASVVLDNGQTWMLLDADDHSRLSAGDAVTIRRGALGSFIMATPSRHTYHVRRVQ